MMSCHGRGMLESDVHGICCRTNALHFTYDIIFIEGIAEAKVKMKQDRTWKQYRQQEPGYNIGKVLECVSPGVESKEPLHHM